MDPHPLVHQLRFARKEFLRVIEGVSEEDGDRRILPMNCIAWIVGHLANQEARYWVETAQQDSAYSWLNDLVGTNRPPSTPGLKKMLAVWREVTARSDVYLDTLNPQVMPTFLERNGKPMKESIGTMLQRNLYHYWFHTGEAHAIRQIMGHKDLPEFVGLTIGFAYAPEVTEH